MVFIEPGRLAWENAPEPRLRSSAAAIVRPIVMGRCDLDTMYLSGRMPLTNGEPIGHEMIAEVVELGDDASSAFRIGQRVIVPAQISCGACRMCRCGETGRCEAVPLGASYGMGRAGGYGGAVAERVQVPFAKGMLTPVPLHTDPVRMMGLTDMASDAWRAIGPQLERRPAGTVLVMGGAAPVIGIYAAALALCLGASRTVYVDSDRRRREAAAVYAVEVAEHLDAVPDASFDIVVDAAGDTELLAAAVRACGPAAQLTSVAPAWVAPPLPMPEIYFKGLTWTVGRPDCHGGHGPVLDAWACRGFRPELVGPKLFAFEDAIDAWLDPALYVAVDAR